jgi:sterol 3beta-glucosyltransferase
MHYAIVAIGSRGDVQPYVALTLGLKDRGDEVTIFAHENFKDFVEGYHIGFVPITGHVEDLLQSAEGMKMLKNGSLFAFMRYLLKMNDVTMQSLIQLTGLFDRADVLLSSLLAVPWVDAIAEKLGKKWAIVQLNLPAVSTKAFPWIVFDFFDFPAYNLFTYHLYEWVYWRVNKKNINSFRRAIGLTELKRAFLKKIAEERIPNLHCFSPALLARPADWSDETDITGFLFLPQSIQFHIPPELEVWLDQGDKPVYIGFGSIPVPDPALIISIIKALLAKTKYRFIYCYNWTPAMDLPDSPKLFQIKTIAHDWLFPRCRAVIIHGGVGTTAAALRTGIPMIIVSIIADQPWWGKIIQKKGVGVHIPFKKLTARKILSALERISMPDIQEKARKTADQINSENGVKNTINKLDYYFGTD